LTIYRLAHEQSLLQFVERHKSVPSVRNRCFVEQGQVYDGVFVLGGHLQTFDDFTLHQYGYVQ
jgi:hypothetical protein